MTRSFPIRAGLTAGALMLAISLSACTAHTRVAGSWQEGAARDQSFANVLVVGLSPDASVRCDFESFMITQLRATGAAAASSCIVMSTTAPLNRETIEAAVTKIGADAVLTTVLVHGEQRAESGGERETRGGGYYKATDVGYAYPWYPYYGGYGIYGMPVVYAEFEVAPVVTSVDGEATILSTLYSTRDAAPVYEVVTTATDLKSRDNALAALTPPIAQKLAKAGLLTGQ